MSLAIGFGHALALYVQAYRTVCAFFAICLFSSCKLFFFKKQIRKYIVLKYSEYFQYEVRQQRCSLVQSPLKK